MELNKLFAAILVAGVTAMLCGFVAKAIIHVERPHENAFKIEVTESAEGGAGAAVVAVAEPILALLGAADVAKGQNVAKVCAACHTFNKGEPGRVGPNLYGIVGNHHAHAEGFAYSDGMKALHEKTWDYAALNNFLWNPKKAVEGTKMGFAGIKKAEDRAAVIAYLRSLSDSPAALPSDADIKAEAPVVETTPDAAAEDAKAEDKKDEAAKDADTKGAKNEALKDDAKKTDASASDTKDADKKTTNEVSKTGQDSGTPKDAATPTDGKSAPVKKTSDKDKKSDKSND